MRRFFDPRFTRVLQEIEEMKKLQIADATAANETAMYTGRSLDKLLALVEENGRSLDAMRVELEQLNRRLSSAPELAPADEIDRA